MSDKLYDVAVVGFGPTGAVAAALLGQAGLQVYVCDKLTGVYEIPRAIAMDHEILRLFQQLGVLDAIAPHVEPFTDSEYFGVDGRLIKRMTMLAPPYPQGHTPSNVFSQPPVERALRDRVARMRNVTVDLGVEMTQVAQDADGVTLQLTQAGEGKRVRARYVVACDGGSSLVRTQLGMPLEDLSFDEPWLVVDVLVNEQGLAKLPKTSVQYCEPDRPCTLVIGPKNHRRWEISLKPDEDSAIVQRPDETWKLLSRWLQPEDGVLWRQSSYRFHALVAEDWRRGRVFLAGDAAHMQPPFLGQGMCQGLRDAANLGWKLAAVLRGDVRGQAAEALLDSYGTERKAHVRELTSRIKHVGEVICERDAAKAQARDAKLLADCDGVVKNTPRQDIIPRLEGGLLSTRESTGRGTLFPQPRVRTEAGVQLLDAIAGNAWRLVCLSANETPSRIGGIADARVVVIGQGALEECDGVVAAWMQRHGCTAALVRPDNYTFGTATGRAAVELLVAEAAALLAPQECVPEQPREDAASLTP